VCSHSIGVFLPAKNSIVIIAAALIFASSGATVAERSRSAKARTLTEVPIGNENAPARKRSPSPQGPMQSPSSPANATSKLASMPMPVSPMTLVAPIFIEDADTTSTITMVNSLPTAIDVDVLLFDLGGNQIAKSTTTVSANAAQQVTARGLLDAASYTGPVYGSVLLMPHRMATLAAQMSIVRRNDALNDIEEEFVMLMAESAPANFRSVASNIAAAPIVAIRSLSNTRRTITIQCLTDAEQRRNGDIPIEPSQTLLLQACGDGPKEITDLSDTSLTTEMRHGTIGISVSSSAPTQELAVFGLGTQREDSHRYLRGMQFIDLSTLMSPTAIYPGVLGESSLFGLQKPRLLLSMANFGASPRKVTVLVTKGSDSASTEQLVATVEVPPGNVVLRNLDSKVLSGDLAPDRSLVVQTDAAIGEVLTDVQLLSSSPDPTLSVPLPWKDSAQVFNGGQHPWRIDGTFSSSVLLFNPDQHDPNSITFSVFSNGQAWTKFVSVPPLATVPMSLNDIILNQEPDNKGRKLPPTATSGIVSWFTLRNPKVFGQLVEADPAHGIVRPFACGQVAVVCDGEITPALILVGGYGTIDGFPIACGGCAGFCGCVYYCGDTSSTPDGAGFKDWGSDNTNITSLVSSNSYSATYLGNNPGNTYSLTTVYDSNGCQASALGAINVAPLLNSISPARGAIGTTLTVTLNGNGFGSSCANVSISAGSGINPTCNSVNNTQIQASFAISATASGGNQSVSVTIAGQTSPSVSFYVQVPKYFTPVGAGTTLNTFCTANQAYYAYVDYQLSDQQYNAIQVQGLTPQESVSVNSGSFSAFASFATPVTTRSDGTFEDIPIGTCFSAAPPPNRCIPVVQNFQILIPGVANPFPITTVTSRTDCEEGINVQITPVPPGTTYTFGIIN